MPDALTAHPLLSASATAGSEPSTRTRGFGLFLDAPAVRELTETLVATRARFSQARETLQAEVRQHRIELDKTREHLELVYDAIPDALLTCNGLGHLQSCNAAARKLLNMSCEACPTLSTLVPDINLQDDEGTIRETWLERADGEHRRVEIQQTRLGIDGSWLIRLRDITEITYTTQRLAEQSYLIEHVDALVLMERVGTGVAWCNPFAEAVLGVSSAQIAGRSLLTFIDEQESPKGAVPRICEAIEARKGFSEAVIFRHVNGRRTWVQLEGHPILEDGARTERFLMLGTDITERKRHEQMQNDFCSMVSHELRTPLTVISGALEALGSAPLVSTAGEANGLLDMGRRNCAQLAFLIDDILDINRLEAGVLRFSSECFDLHPLLKETLHGLSTVAADAQVRLVAEPMTQSVHVTADPQRVKQALVNIVGNAIKFSSPGSVVEIDLHTDPCAGSAVISVRDQGPGIPLEFQPRLFQKFSRDAAVQASGKDGFGLGLAITRSLLEGMGGRIAFESDGRSGTTFHLTFPTPDRAVEPDETEKQACTN